MKTFNLKNKKKEYAPLVSVALTTSKSERFIRIQMDSILNQTYKNLEVCVSHDECGDSTVDILNDYVTKDTRVKWKYNTLEKGFRKNTEHAISMCTGDIIFLCDHDDVWYEDRVQMHVDAYRDQSVDWVYNRTDLIDAEGNKIGYLEDEIPDYYTKERMSLLNYAWGSCIGAAETSFRTDVLRSAMPIPSYVPGHDSWIELAIYPKKSVYIEEVLQGYRQHSNNEVGWAKKMTPEEFKEKEQQAIRENMIYLKRLYGNQTLSYWKRFFFFCAYWAKIVRAKIKSDKRGI